jgi:hypothetical protein
VIQTVAAEGAGVRGPEIGQPPGLGVDSLLADLERNVPDAARVRPLAEVLDAISDAETRLAQLRDSAAIADQPDRAWVDDWLHRSYLNFWARDR